MKDDDSREPTPRAFKPPASASPWERFQSLVRHVVNVPKAETDKLEAEYQRERKKKRAKA